MTLLIILQNAYGLRADTPLPVWDRLLWRSYTGKRLKEMLPDEVADYTVTNASKMIGQDAGSVCPPDKEHIRSMIEFAQPRVILACGKIAQQALTEMGVEFIAAPHPAWRMLTKEMTAAIREQLRQALGED